MQMLETRAWVRFRPWHHSPKFLNNINRWDTFGSKVGHVHVSSLSPSSSFIAPPASCFWCGAPGLAVLARILAYLLAGIPAAIGVAFVARYAFVTSDTAIDGASNAFLFGMIAAGAFGGPTVAVALASNGRKLAAGIFGVLAVLAMATNWSHTLGAVAHRGAGTEAEREGQG